MYLDSADVPWESLRSSFDQKEEGRSGVKGVTNLFRQRHNVGRVVDRLWSVSTILVTTEHPVISSSEVVRHWRIIALVCLFAASIAVCLYICRAQPFAFGFDAPVVVPDNALALGTVWEQKELRVSLPVLNRGTDPVRIAAIDAPCRCTTFLTAPRAIPPNGKSEIHLALDLLPQSEDDFRRREREVRFPIDITFAPPSLRPRRFVLTGRVRRFLQPAPQMLSFYDGTLVEGRSFPSSSVTVRTFEPLMSLGARVVGCPGWLCEVEPVGDESLFRVRVEPSSSLRAGPFRFTLELSAVTSVGEHLPTFPIPIVGQVCKDIYVLPDRVFFTPQNQSMILQSRTGLPFRLIDVRLRGARGDVEWRPTGSGYLVSLSGAAPADGESSVELAVANINEDVQHVSVPICVVR